MKIVNLVENTPGAKGCGTEHGLCFYIVTERHRLLLDTGATGLFLKNAEMLGLDLRSVDTVVLSHGHYDHGGGIPAFAIHHPNAKIYLSENAFGSYYDVPDSEKEEQNRYIGLPQEAAALPQIVKVPAGENIFRIDGELEIFSGIRQTHPIPSANRSLKKKTENGFEADDFSHEQCLVIRQGRIRVLLSGCAHHGILNILDRYRELYHEDPDHVISGFHMMRKYGYSDDDLRNIADTAHALKKFDKTVFYTCHCTGVQPYEEMRKILGDQLRYVHCGDEIRIGTEL